MENETPLKLIIARNLASLRKEKGVTQIQLAELFGYSDKAVSKWEHGEALPDIEILASLADYYGVTLDYLTHEGTRNDKKQYLSDKKSQRINKNIIVVLAALIAPLVFILAYSTIALIPGSPNFWTLFIWWIPVDAIVVFVFNCIWGPIRLRPFWSIFMSWSVLTALYLELGRSLPDNRGWGAWFIFFIGVPLTIAAILWTHVKTRD